MPTGPPPWAEAVAERGGSMIDTRGGFDGAAPFVVVHCCDLGILPALARVSGPMAVLLWLQQAPDDRDAELANALLGRLEGVPAILAIKQGWVAGPSDRPGAFEVDAGLIAPTIDAVVGGEATWEEDPDFDYAVAALVPGLEAESAAARALLPRLLYADHDRVYEHAGLVAARKRELAGVARDLHGLDERVTAAAGWPPVPTGDDWRN